MDRSRIYGTGSSLGLRRIDLVKGPAESRPYSSSKTRSIYSTSPEHNPTSNPEGTAKRLVC